MSDLESIKRYYRRSQIILRIVMVLLVIFILKEFILGFIAGLGEATQDAMRAPGTPSPHAGLRFDATDLSFLLFIVITRYMISILKEFDSGRFFTATVLQKTFKIGLMTEITCFALIPLLGILHAPAPASGWDYFELFFQNINYVGGVAGTFIRHLSKLFMISKDLEEINELTV